MTNLEDKIRRALRRVGQRRVMGRVIAVLCAVVAVTVLVGTAQFGFTLNDASSAEVGIVETSEKSVAKDDEGTAASEQEPESDDAAQTVQETASSAATEEAAASASDQGDSNASSQAAEQSTSAKDTSAAQTTSASASDASSTKDQSASAADASSKQTVSEQPAPTETATDWEKTVAGVTLGDDPAANIVAIAQTQVGNVQRSDVTGKAADGTTRAWSRYGAFAGDPYAAQPAALLNFVLHYAGNDTLPSPDVEAPLSAWSKAVSNANEKLLLAADGTMPEPGSIVLLDANGDGAIDNAGIVELVAQPGASAPAAAADALGAYTAQRDANATGAKRMQLILVDDTGTVVRWSMGADDARILDVVLPEVPEEEPSDSAGTEDEAASGAEDGAETGSATESATDVEDTDATIPDAQQDATASDAAGLESSVPEESSTSEISTVASESQSADTSSLADSLSSPTSGSIRKTSPLALTISSMGISPMATSATTGSITAGRATIVSGSNGTTSDSTERTQGSDGVYYRYTGEVLTTNITINETNVEDTSKVRVYVQLTPNDASCPGEIFTSSNNSLVDGGTYTFADGHEYSFHKVTGTDNTYYLEFPYYGSGSSLNLNLITTYASPTTPGGGAKIWAVTVPDTEETGTLVSSAEVQEGDWATSRDEYFSSKVDASDSDAVLVRGTVTDNGVSKDVYFLKGVAFKATNNKTARTSPTTKTLGQDNVQKVTYTDTTDLPDGVYLNPEIVADWGDKTISSNAYNPGAHTLYWKYGNDSVTYANYASLYWNDENGVAHRILTLQDFWSSTGTGSNGQHPWPEAKLVDGNIQLVWHFEDPNWTSATTAFNPAKTYSISYGDNVFVTDIPTDSSTASATVSNNVSQTVDYSWTDDSTSSSNATTKAITVSPTTLSVTKTHDEGTYPTISRGDPITFTVTAKASGTDPVSATTMVDELPTAYYVSSSQIWSMLVTDTTDGPNLTISAENVRIVERTDSGQPASVTTASGGTGSPDAQHSNDGGTYSNPPYDPGNVKKSNATMSFSRTSDGKVQATIDGTTTTVDSADALQALLDSSGVVIQYETTYKLTYTIPDGTIAANATVTWDNVQATAKDSFMLARDDSTDRDQQKQSLDGGDGTNKATVNAGSLTTSGTDSVPITNEYAISKQAQTDGDWFDAGSADKNVTGAGDVASYKIQVSRSGSDSSPEYDALPLEDQICNGQVLLAPVSLNPGLEPSGLETIEYNGESYYKLAANGSESATYSNVVFSGVSAGSGTTFTAASVVVTPESSDTTTLVRWYLHTADYPKDGVVEIDYQTLLDPTSTGYKVPADSDSYTSKDYAFLGDMQGERLFDEADVKVSKLSPEKGIVTDKMVESDPSDDETTSTSILSDGSEVTYRIKVKYTGDGSAQTLTSEDFYDALPKSLTGDATWSWADSGHVVSVEFPQQDGVTVTGGDTWSVSDVAPGSTETDSTQQYLVWGDGFSMTLTGDAYVYVTLQYPSDDLWSAYESAYASTGVQNTVHVRDQESTVYHALGEPAKARLQKGVVETGTVSDGHSLSTTSHNGYKLACMPVNASTGVDGRTSYTPDTGNYLGYVVYYVTIVNDGSSRLYLNDIQDKVPDGFKYLGGYGVGSNTSINGRSLTASWNGHAGSILSCLTQGDIDFDYTTGGNVYAGGFDDWGTTSTKLPFTVTGSRSSYTAKIAGIHATNEGGNLYFKIDNTYPENNLAGNDPKEQGNLSYDSIRDQYYLNPGEYLGFSYVMLTNDADGSNVETNVAAMPFDSRGVDVSVAETDIQSKDFESASANDGDSSVEDRTFAKENGLTGSSTTSQWLVSSVSLNPPEVVPGITKVVASRTQVGSSSPNTDTTFATGTDTINWEVTARNDGSAPISKYTISDIVGSPYLYTGDVKLALNGSAARTIMSFGEWTSTDGSTPVTAANAKSVVVSIRNPATWSTTTTTLTVNGGYVAFRGLNSSSYYYRAALKRTDDGRLRLDITAYSGYKTSSSWSSDDQSILPGQQAVLQLSTVNKSSASSMTLFNDATFTPLNTNTYNEDKVQFGTNIDYDAFDGSSTSSRRSVRAQAIIPIRDYAGATAVIGVTAPVTEEDGSESSVTALCTDEPNYVTLENASDVFTYTLDVKNVSENNMTAFTIIDGLPETGDHYSFYKTNERDSQFNVDFATNPKVTVQIVDDEGNISLLDPSLYTVEWSEKTEFTQDDWDGKTSTGWDSYPDSARSFRIRMANGTIPPGYIVRVTFDAKANKGTIPTGKSAIAWNSFGYQATINGNNLEATPLKVGVRVMQSWNATIVKFAEDYTYENSSTGETETGKIYDGTDGEHAMTTDEATLKKGDQLPGAVIGLYSPSVDDKIDDSDLESKLAEYGLLAGDVPRTISKDGAVYYLKDLGETAEYSAGFLKPANGANGDYPPAFVQFTGLTESKYLVKELKAPEGYTLGKNKELIITADTSYDVGINKGSELPSTGGDGDDDETATEDSYKANAFFTDETGYSLPETGGHGNERILAFGLLVALACFVGLVIRSRRKISE